MFVLDIVLWTAILIYNVMVLVSLMNDNERFIIDMNDTLQNGDLSSVSSLLNSHALLQDN